MTDAYKSYKQAHFPKANLSEDLTIKFDIVQGLCVMLLERELEHPENHKVEEKLGCVYAWKGSNRKALRIFKKSGTAEANYQCGRIYEYGGGDVPQNLKLAERFFSSSKQDGT